MYRAALLDFVEFADAWDGGEAIECFADLDYWLAFYAHQAYVTGHPKKYKVTRAVCATEHWMPEAKPLRLVRRCLRGWDRLVPSKPAAPMPRDLARATATMAALLAKTASALAMLLAHDTWLRIGECAGLRVRDVVDSREHADPVMRGVSVFIPEAKTGRRQAVRVEDAEIAVLLVAWRDAVEASEGPDARLFPSAARLRSDLAEALAPFRVEARGLHFTFQSFRHGGASRAYLAGSDMADILLRGRWKVESSGKHCIQAGRQLLLGLQLPPEVTALACRIEEVGLVHLFDADLADQLG